MRLVAAAVALIALGGCRQASRAVETLLPPPRVVLPAGNLSRTAIDDHGQRAEPPYWTPLPDEIAQAEAKLPVALHETWDPRAHGIPDKLEGYGRQYFGVTISGRRTLVVNAFCANWVGSDLEAEVFKVWDGGSCYFAGYYDVADSRFTTISVNAAG